MTIDKQKLKAAALAIDEGNALEGPDADDAMIAFEDVATPSAILALLAEIERLEDSLHGASAEVHGLSLQLNRACRARDEARMERDQLKAENEALKSPETGYAGAFYDFCRLVGVANASPESPASVFKGQVVPAVEALRKDAERWTFFKDLSCQIQAFPHSWGQMTPEKMDFMCDEAMTKGAKQ